MNDRPSHKPRDPAVAYLVGMLGVAVVFLFIWLVFAGGLWIGVRNVGTVPAYIFGVAVWLYPIALIVSGVLAYRAYRAGKERRARRLALVPYLWIVPIILIIVNRS